MGAAKRRAQARWSKMNCATCKHLGNWEMDPERGAEEQQRERAVFEQANPHTCFVVAPPTPKVLATTLTILVPRDVAEAIDQLYEFIKKHYATRNDFLEDLLKAGLQEAFDAQRRAQAALMAAAEADKAAQQPLVELAQSVPSNIADLVLAQHTKKPGDAGLLI